MKTLTDIEAEARRLCGDGFVVSDDRDDWGVSFIVIQFSEDSSNEAWFFEEPAMNKFGVEVDAPDYSKLARFVAICSQLDNFIKGEE